MQQNKNKILIAAGGTGGHLFPAQALAQELLKKQEGVELLFAGGGLSTNRCFQKDTFPFEEIFAATPYLTKKGSFFRSLWTIVKGIRQSFAILSKFRPSLVVGFGSYHAFPLLVAAVFKKIPIMLFEPNSAPGKVNRLFSRKAVVSAVQFAQAADQLSGKIVEVNMPLWEKEGVKGVSIEEARAYFSLDATKLTFLVFGGSQGAVSINQLFAEAISLFAGQHKDFQVIHFTGKQSSAEEARRVYARLGIPACVKEFEDRMYLAWQAASLVICRSGAATLAEQAAFEVPGILIPYPYATDDHQMKNALFMENQVGGAVHLSEADSTPEKLCALMHDLLNRLQPMRENMHAFKTLKQKQNLSNIIYNFLEKDHG